MTIDIKEFILQLFEEHVTDKSLFVVDVEISKGKRSKLTLIIDGDSGVSSDHCTLVSNAISPLLDEKDFFEGNYLWEVSSPGVDRPLKVLRQYPQHIGRRLSIKLKDGSQYEGKLISIAESMLSFVIEAEKEITPEIIIEGGHGLHKTKKKKRVEIVSQEVVFADVESAIVLVSFK